MHYVELIEKYVPKVATPNEGARNFGISLSRIHSDRFVAYKDDVNNYEYDDDKQGRAVRYRFIVGKQYYAFLQHVMPEINAAGWHLTSSTKRSGSKWQLVFEPILAPRTPRQGMYWHLAPRQNVENILHNGLEPRTSRHGLNYPQNRIYMIRNERDAKLMADSFAKRDKKPIQYAVIRADLRNATGIKLHVDPELMRVAVYTTQPIPPQYLSLAHESIPESE